VVCWGGGWTGECTTKHADKKKKQQRGKNEDRGYETTTQRGEEREMRLGRFHFGLVGTGWKKIKAFGVNMNSAHQKDIAWDRKRENWEGGRAWKYYDPFMGINRKTQNGNYAGDRGEKKNMLGKKEKEWTKPKGKGMRAAQTRRPTPSQLFGMAERGGKSRTLHVTKGKRPSPVIP